MIKMDREKTQMQKHELKSKNEINGFMHNSFKKSRLLGAMANYTEHDIYLDWMMRQIYVDARLDADRCFNDSQVRI
ncbi:MAG: hypothetical protein LBQ79_03240 [Deltaproteobacteria bacterium]|nr:hypothetical protein [Deltaproteobacteria bacterium]